MWDSAATFGFAEELLGVAEPASTLDATATRCLGSVG